MDNALVDYLIKLAFGNRPPVAQTYPGAPNATSMFQPPAPLPAPFQSRIQTPANPEYMAAIQHPNRAMVQAPQPLNLPAVPTQKSGTKADYYSPDVAGGIPLGQPLPPGPRTSNPYIHSPEANYAENFLRDTNAPVVHPPPDIAPRDNSLYAADTGPTPSVPQMPAIGPAMQTQALPMPAAQAGPAPAMMPPAPQAAPTPPIGPAPQQQQLPVFPTSAFVPPPNGNEIGPNDQQGFAQNSVFTLRPPEDAPDASMILPTSGFMHTSGPPKAIPRPSNVPFDVGLAGNPEAVRQTAEAFLANHPMPPLVPAGAQAPIEPAPRTPQPQVAEVPPSTPAPLADASIAPRMNDLMPPHLKEQLLAEAYRLTQEKKSKGATHGKP